MDDVSIQRDRLLTVLAAMPGAAVALSGGVDSAVVAKAAFEALGANAVAVTANSPSVARRDLDDARRIAQVIGIRHIVVATEEFDDASYVKNDGVRCYFCKSELYTRIEKLLPELGLKIICSGANLDDLGDYRPGLVAAAEHGVRHPLQEAGFTKSAVRALARHWQLPVADKPASPCLSSRIAPGLAVTVERTQRVESAEAILQQFGFVDGRVRHHEGDLARMEVPLSDVVRIAEDTVRKAIESRFRELGFRYITLDLTGFRSGSLNELIPLDVKASVRERLTMVTT